MPSATASTANSSPPKSWPSTPLRATPAERLENGRDFVPTNKWVVFGHHFAAIAGPGPLVGPVLAAQFGYLPGTLWILAGAVFGGCVQDFVILLFSVRRDGKSLTEMARNRNWPPRRIRRLRRRDQHHRRIAGRGCALIVVNALKASPWGTFTIAMTIPIALLMGVYLRTLRPGKVLETSALGFVLVMLAIWGGQWVSHNSDRGQNASRFTAPGAGDPHHHLRIRRFGAAGLVAARAARLPEHVRETGNDRAAGAGNRCACVPRCTCRRSPASSTAPARCSPGKIFPFAFITIACGAISGFHALISSGTTPKLIRRESETRMVGYGAMMAESLVAIMATDCRLRAAAWNLFRDQQSRRNRRPGAGSGSGDHQQLGISRHRRRNACAGPGRGRADALQPHRRRSRIRRRDGAHFLAPASADRR